MPPARGPRWCQADASSTLSLAWAPCCIRFDPAEPRAQVGAQLVDGVELAGELGELVVGLGQLALFDRVEVDRDLRLAPGILSGHQNGR